MKDLLPALPDLLLPWFRENQRELPWRRDREPYHVWVSEIMLQQTRVEAVRGYYARFLQRLPTVQALAAVEEPELLKLWEGLGYYNRARNLKRAARVICDVYGGSFPTAYDAVRALPGIGPYTAGAICSICFELPTPAVDGNVLRVLARALDKHDCVDDPKVKAQCAATLAEVYPPGACGAFTQALMELGATVCVPNGAPACGRCPLGERCLARARGTIDDLPVRAEKRKRRQEELTVFLLRSGGRCAVRRRAQEGLLAGLYELPNVPGRLEAAAIVAQAEAWGLHPTFLEKTVGRRHIFTHVEWHMTGALIHCGAQSEAFEWVNRNQVAETIALPTAFRQFLPDIWEDAQ